uniref:EOG090X0H1B n=1 Tax=Ceriodaphnia reticulata TaxID=302197 RepID=A0A4Y7M0Q1_9CRUS|nr:EOG090X0H1B [Ceriodaphnia reticulata]SVE73279.1 EOG090X0H1B [Ceriodaphnia reticulata]
MQTDEEVGKVAAPVPCFVSLTAFNLPRALELFVESLLTKAVQITSARNAKTLSPAHLKQCILAESRFDFLKDLVLTIPDVQADGEDSGVTSVPSTPTTQPHQPLMFRSISEAGSSSSASRRHGLKESPTVKRLIRVTQKMTTMMTITALTPIPYLEDLRRLRTVEISLQPLPIKRLFSLMPSSLTSIKKLAAITRLFKSKLIYLLKLLQVTPWGSPRLLSPVDVRHIVHEYAEGDHHYSPSSSPSRYRWSRAGSLKATGNRVELDFSSDTKLKECEQLWLVEKENIMQHLPELLSDSQREISFQEAQYLAAMLTSDETQLILGALTVIANLAVFSANQDTLREAGLIAVLPKLILHSNRQIKQKTFAVVTNMAINEKNNGDMRTVTISLAYMVQATPLSDSSLVASALTALINIAVLPTWHKEIKTLLHKAYSLLDEGQWSRDGAPSKLIYMLDVSIPDEVVLRVLTLLANIASVTKRTKIDPLDLPAENKAAAPDTMYAAVFGLSMVERFKKKALILSERNSNPDVCMQARKLWEALSE